MGALDRRAEEAGVRERDGEEADPRVELDEAGAGPRTAPETGREDRLHERVPQEQVALHEALTRHAERHPGDLDLDARPRPARRAFLRAPADQDRFAVRARRHDPLAGSPSTRLGRVPDASAPVDERRLRRRNQDRTGLDGLSARPAPHAVADPAFAFDEAGPTAIGVGRGEGTITDRSGPIRRRSAGVRRTPPFASPRAGRRRTRAARDSRRTCRSADSAPHPADPGHEQLGDARADEAFPLSTSSSETRSPGTPPATKTTRPSGRWATPSPPEDSDSISTTTGRRPASPPPDKSDTSASVGEAVRNRLFGHLHPGDPTARDVDALDDVAGTAIFSPLRGARSRVLKHRPPIVSPFSAGTCQPDSRLKSSTLTRPRTS